MRRRTLLLSGLGVAGALLIGFGVLPPRSRTGTGRRLAVEGGEVALNGWIKVAPDGTIGLAMARAEMGQGVHTALATLVADELDVELSRIVLFDAGADALYGNVATNVAMLPLHPQGSEPGRETRGVRLSRWMLFKVARELGISVTGGSSSIADAWWPLRLAAATARAQLLGAAALRWKLPLAELSVRDGVVGHGSGPRAHYGELVAQAAATPPGAVTLKTPAEWRLIGNTQPRIDIPAKSDGSARFGLDVRLPGLLFASVRHCPMLGGSVGTVDAAAAMKLPGVERVVRLGVYGGSTPGVAVLGRSTWHARRGADALDIEWRPAPAGTADSGAIERALERSVRDAAARDGGLAFHTRGDARAALERSARKVEALYRAPYLAHAALEPMNCTARVADGKVEVWAPTQAPTAARAIAARVAGVPEVAVTLHVTYLGGGFGRRLEVDFIGQAVRIALECGGRPVMLVWPREEDFTHDFYRPAGAALLRAGFDGNGALTALSITSAGDATVPRLIERTMPWLAGPADLPDKTVSEGLYDLPYAVPNQRISHVTTRHAVPVGSWRSVGHSHNAFFSEGFIDELAHATGADPVSFRLGLLKDLPRHAVVLLLAADKAGWGTPPPPGRARGVALRESYGSIVAQVVEASIEGNRPRVHRVVCAIDCGVAVNPGIVAQQMESAVIFGLSAALHGRIDIEAGVVQQRNFPDQPLLGLRDAPSIETHIVPSTREPGGAGEPGTPPVAPALASALFQLTGRRLRELPLRLA